ncbi:hypothetical protein OHC33_011029 [Knufia fluminis]|uniref:Prion-inhibition and propagation HeLo domain-containing protein n=1 Tax=Knufia fluminis TaxID=191047 RepID=A0AAN8E7K2_9EURO|nr:hypothetical protein OHC33_011029 [Knufia fluminis]
MPGKHYKYGYEPLWFYFQTVDLRLDIVKLRLSRWGFALSLSDPGPESTSTISASDKDMQTAIDLLKQIVQLFDDTEKASTKLKPSHHEATTGDTNNKLDPAGTSLHDKVKFLSLKRFTPREVLKWTKWALFKEKHLNRLIEDMTELVDAFIELCILVI